MLYSCVCDAPLLTTWSCLTVRVWCQGGRQHGQMVQRAVTALPARLPASQGERHGGGDTPICGPVDAVASSTEASRDPDLPYRENGRSNLPVLSPICQSVNTLPSYSLFFLTGQRCLCSLPTLVWTETLAVTIYDSISCNVVT